MGRRLRHLRFNLLWYVFPSYYFSFRMTSQCLCKLAVDHGPLQAHADERSSGHTRGWDRRVGSCISLRDWDLFVEGSSGFTVVCSLPGLWNEAHRVSGNEGPYMLTKDREPPGLLQFQLAQDWVLCFALLPQLMNALEYPWHLKTESKEP